MVPQTSPQWRQTAGNEHTKDSVSVMAARNCATGTARITTTTRTAAKMTTATAKATVGQQRQRQILRRSRTMTWHRIRLAAQLLVLLAAVNFVTHIVTCSCSSTNNQSDGIETQLTTFPRSTLPDRPMTTQNDLIRTAQNSTAERLTVKLPTTATAETATTTTRALTKGAVYGSTTLGLSSTAPTITKTIAAVGAAKSAQIGLTMEPTKAAEMQTASASAATRTMIRTSTMPSPMTMATMFISTIYPASSTDPVTAVPVQMATASALTETEAHDSIEMATLVGTSGEEENAVLRQPHAHPANADSLTKGFSIPTFLPPFPVFAAADLPAYRAAAAAAEAAAAAAAADAAAMAAAASTVASETVTLSAKELRQQMYNEQLAYLATHNEQLEPGQQPRRNLTVPELNITAQMGNHAYMPCQIHRLSDKPVSWVRLRDGHIISVDEVTFIADERFQSIYQADDDYTWSLQLKYVQPSDAGWYECQMATEPKLSAKVHLEIITPKTELIGDQSRFVKVGSKVALHCIVRGTLDPPKYIIWFRGQKKISETDERTGWYTQLDRNIFGNVGDNQNTIGSLIIPFVRKEDSGNYTCQPSNSVSVSVDLHVLSGEYSASAIMSSATEQTQRSTWLLLLLLLPLTGSLLEAVRVLAGPCLLTRT